MVLVVYIAVAKFIKGRPNTGKHIQAVVKCPIFLPVVRYFKWVYNVGISSKFGKILPYKQIPVAVKMRTPHFFRHVLKLPFIVRVALHEDVIVIYLCGDKYIVLGPLTLLVIAVDKKSFHPLMAYAAGVARIVHACGISGA